MLLSTSRFTTPEDRKNRGKLFFEDVKEERGLIFSGSSGHRLQFSFAASKYYFRRLTSGYAWTIT